jgi:hypothetical protein
MIARLLRTAATLFVCFCVATLIAETITLAYVWSAWQLDGDRLAQAVAIARGIGPSTTHEDEAGLGEVSPEQPSYDAIVGRRALKFRDLELRELALKSALAQLKSQQGQLAEDLDQQRRRAEQLDARLKGMQEGAEAEGRDVVRRTLESIKPDQAKEQLFEMLQNDEIDEVVLLLSAMQDSKRAKIIAEFKTPEENQKLAEVLRLIREGEPVSSLAEEATPPLKPDVPTGA